MSGGSPRAGVEYPASYAEVRSWYPSDSACLDYLDWLRWPTGFSCPLCRSSAGWKLPDGRWSCGRCGRRVSATAGTIFHATRTPLTVWFAAAWMLVSQKHGISALGLKRVLGIGSEQTAWAMLHRYRTAMVRPGRDRLTGVVEADETFFGAVAPSELQAHEMLPSVHLVVALAKRWLLGTHQGAVTPAHLQAYLDEFAFRFNRRRSRSRGMLFYRLLEQAVQAPPRTYRSLVADAGAGRRELQAPGPGKRVRPPSLAGQPLDRPWRRSPDGKPLST